MTVGELIELLQKCPKDWPVMYDSETHCMNEAITMVNDTGEVTEEYSMDIGDVLVGGGTTRGFVYLTAEPFEEK